MKKLGIVAGVVALAMSTACATGPETEAADTPSPTPKETAEVVVEETPEPEPVDLKSFEGLESEGNAFKVTVLEAYRETALSDGYGFSVEAPEDMQYNVLYLSVENIGNAPEWFDATFQGETHTGARFNNDSDAEMAAYDYEKDIYFDELNPRSEATTYAIFLLPEDETLASVDIALGGTLAP